MKSIVRAISTRRHFSIEALQKPLTTFDGAINPSIQQIARDISKLTLLETSQLIQILKVIKV
jgi:hypothetical protein